MFYHNYVKMTLFNYFRMTSHWNVNGIIELNLILKLSTKKRNIIPFLS